MQEGCKYRKMLLQEPCYYRNKVWILFTVHSVQYIYVHKQSSFYSIVNIGSMKIKEDAIIANIGTYMF